MGTPATIDGKATLAVASSLVKHGTADITVLGSAEGLLPPVSRMGAFGTDGLLYAKKGVTPSLLLLPLVALAHANPSLPVRTTAMLFNPIVMTLTALLLYSFARRLGYRPQIAFIAALTYGLGTFALTYTQSLFGEPLAGLLLLGAILAAFRYRHAPRSHLLGIAGGLLGLVVGINISYALMAPLIGLYTFGLQPRQWKLRPVLQILAPFAAIIALLLIYNAARFGNPLTNGYHFAEGEGFNFPFLIGIFGLTFSPYRGLFWFSPVLWLALPGGWRFRLRYPNLLAIILAVTVTQLATYASWWSWHGGLVWGPRFMLPVLPLLVLLLLPILDQLGSQRLLAAVFAVVVSLSLAIQVLGALYDSVPYTISLYDNYATGIEGGFFTGLSHEVVFRPDLSPLLGQIKLAQAGQPPQPALLQTNDGPHLLFALLPLVAVVIGSTRRVFIPAVAAIIVLAPLGVAIRQQHTLTETSAIKQTLMPADTIITATTRYEANLIDFKLPTRIITTNAPTQANDPLASGLWAYAMQQPGLAWFVTWFPAASADNWQEHDLWQRASFVRETVLDSERALLFEMSPPVEAAQDGGWRFGPILLDSYGIARDPDGVRLSLVWTAAAVIDQDYRWFVHLVDAGGQIVQQQDRAPQGGYAPASTWQRGERIRDHLFFPLANDVNSTGWQLRIGYVDPLTSDRLPVSDAAGTAIEANFLLLPIR